MTNPNDAIHQQHWDIEQGAFVGYTKREDMAVKFMASILTTNGFTCYEDAAIYAVTAADALIKRLNDDDNT